MRQPILTLTTDFGLHDHFVATMKGVILGLCPTARLVDITHDIAPFEISEGAFTLMEAWQAFPKKTIHVGVVDPGVGSARRPILVEAGGHYFVGPDNGLFAMIYGPLLDRGEPVRVRHLTNEAYFRQPLSRTFHGRDIFAPVAAHLASGVTPAKFGPRIDDFLKIHNFWPTRTSKRLWTGQVLKIDRFGNLISNFSEAEFGEIKTRPFALNIGTEKIQRLALNYAEVPFGEPVAIIGSSGFVEVCVNQGHAAKQLGCGVGAPIELQIW
ncbi:MAG: SAM-dependent chlorinase/fluorinase [Bryobacteraceae bacterium]|nr:SAM-dependent chlorinase/fluorinase [Bryobacteraceae bacterium]